MKMYNKITFGKIIESTPEFCDIFIENGNDRGYVSFFDCKILNLSEENILVFFHVTPHYFNSVKYKKHCFYLIQNENSGSPYYTLDACLKYEKRVKYLNSINIKKLDSKFNWIKKGKYFIIDFIENLDELLLNDFIEIYRKDLKKKNWNDFAKEISKKSFYLFDI